MGLTGLILTVRFRMQRIPSSYLLVDYERARDLDQVLTRFEEDDARYQYSVAWIDCLAGGAKVGRSVLMRGNPAHPDDLPTGMRDRVLETHGSSQLFVPFSLPGPLLSRGIGQCFNALTYHRHRKRVAVPLHYDAFFYPLDTVSNWNRAYGSRGFFQYQTVFDTTASQRGIASILDVLRNSGRACFLAVLKAFGDGSGGLLSFPKRGYTLAMDIPNRDGTREFLARLDNIVCQHGGRVYLAKDACMTTDAFREMYPSASDFKGIKTKLDPSGRFNSSLARRIGLA